MNVLFWSRCDFLIGFHGRGMPDTFEFVSNEVLSYQIINSPPLPNIIVWSSTIVTPLLSSGITRTREPYYRLGHCCEIMRGFHTTFARGRLLLRTWSCPFWDFACFLVLRLVSSEANWKYRGMFETQKVHSKLKRCVDTWQVREWMVSSLEQVQVSNGIESGDRRRKRSLVIFSDFEFRTSLGISICFN